MQKFEKYLSNEMNITGLILFQLQLKTNNDLKKEFERYKNNRINLKSMFLINEAEKEIKQNSKLKSIDNSVNTLLQSKTKNSEIINFLEYAF